MRSLKETIADLYFVITIFILIPFAYIVYSAYSHPQEKVPSIIEKTTSLSHFEKYALHRECKTPKKCDVSVKYDISRDFDPSEQYDTTNRQILRILFVGNSYTFMNDMPHIVETLAKNDPNSSFYVETDQLVEGGATLDLLLTLPHTKTLLSKEKWDYVVLQPQSLWAMQSFRAHSVNKSLAQWRNRIRKIGAKPVFFMTWPRQPDKGWYTSKKFAALKNFDLMYENILSLSEYVANEYYMILAPIGYYFVQTFEQHPEIDIYNPDGNHPSKKASFLIASLFYRLLVNETLDDIEYTPEYLTSEEKAVLFEMANNTEIPSPFEQPPLPPSEEEKKKEEE